MTARATNVFPLAFAANVAWDDLLGILWFKMRHSPTDIYLFAVFWLLPLIAYLIVLYQTAELLRWPRVLRAIALCGVSFIATLGAVWVAAALAAIVWFILHYAAR
jgi:hypothetical protein